MNLDDFAPGRLAVADQVIVSAGNIMVAAGFERAEIAAFFRQAADQLTLGIAASGDVAASGQSQVDDAEPPKRTVGDIRLAFATIAPVRALSELTLETAAPRLSGDGSMSVDQQLEIAARILPHIAEAQNWLRAAADDAGISLVANREVWLAEASNKYTDHSAAPMFLDEFEAAYKSSFDLVTDSTIAIVDRGDKDALHRLLMSLVDSGISVTHELKQAMEQGVSILMPVA